VDLGDRLVDIAEVVKRRRDPHHVNAPIPKRKRLGHRPSEPSSRIGASASQDHRG
jgi:hypothetical protein